jgi:hypothetical protein
LKPRKFQQKTLEARGVQGLSSYKQQALGPSVERKPIKIAVAGSLVGGIHHDFRDTNDCFGMSFNLSEFC